MTSLLSRREMRECIFNKGQSKRIWNELYKVWIQLLQWSCENTDFVLSLQVVDSSDVVIQVRINNNTILITDYTPFCSCHNNSLCTCSLTSTIFCPPGARCSWPPGHSLQAHWVLPEEGEVSQTCHPPAQQVWPCTHLGHGENMRG